MEINFHPLQTDQEFELIFDPKILQNFLGRFTALYVTRILQYRRDSLQALVILPELLPVANFATGQRKSQKTRTRQRSYVSVPNSQL